MKFSEQISDERRLELEALARAEAERVRGAEDLVAYTDGLGAMGLGSYEDGPAAIQSAEYKRVLRERFPDGF